MCGVRGVGCGFQGAGELEVAAVVGGGAAAGESAVEGWAVVWLRGRGTWDTLTRAQEVCGWSQGWMHAVGFWLDVFACKQAGGGRVCDGGCGMECSGGKGRGMEDADGG